ncbi:Pom34p SCDLUD_001755 [Saccharomycodes ludwigii]|uniref:Pom34p n=1 Tax=Saccharomycodes ludwigii TaxID=36035 RepID=UPI001E832497|nr:hypothetical protein SCDLUD_001755 [Saccharomycodes ludwigii]KAH3901969.1 hypothetical protein SCDLUD_001755 [Saccharomycodes ludwigii]
MDVDPIFCTPRKPITDDRLNFLKTQILSTPIVQKTHEQPKSLRESIDLMNDSQKGVTSHFSENKSQKQIAPGNSANITLKIPKINVERETRRLIWSVVTIFAVHLVVKFIELIIWKSQGLVLKLNLDIIFEEYFLKNSTIAYLFNVCFFYLKNVLTLPNIEKWIFRLLLLNISISLYKLIQYRRFRIIEEKIVNTKKNDNNIRNVLKTPIASRDVDSTSISENKKDDGFSTSSRIDRIPQGKSIDKVPYLFKGIESTPLKSLNVEKSSNALLSDTNISKIMLNKYSASSLSLPVTPIKSSGYIPSNKYAYKMMDSPSLKRKI